MKLASQYPTGALFISLFLLTIVLVRSKQGRGLVPGPRGLPILGNVLEVPATKAWFYFRTLGKRFGPLISFSIVGERVLILNRGSDAVELLGKRASIYSSRPNLVFAGKYWSQNRRLVFLPYGDHLKHLRAAFHHMLQSRNAGAYDVHQEVEACKLTYDMLIKPEDVFLNIKRYASALIYSLAYGRRLEGNDEDLKNILGAIFDIDHHVRPGAHLVDSLPILDKLPDVLAPWRKHALQGYKRTTAIYGGLAKDVLQRVSQGDVSTECFTARLWAQQEKLNLDDESIAYLAGTAFEAGAGTTSGEVLWFLAAAVLYPETVKIARSEMDAILHDRAPMLQDLESLPYCTGLVKEVLRWGPAVPAGIPHRLDRDDTYQDYRITEGTTVIANIWAMHHDEETYDNPKVFEPRRWTGQESGLNRASLLEGHFGFGFGRRICPGRALGAASVWIAIVRLIWAFDIHPDIDETTQRPARPDPYNPENWAGELITEPREFPVRVVPRSEEHADAIRREWDSLSELGDGIYRRPAE
ncbi:cytochrome P450 [Heliocybe sulcata]|uniref:Cytochrome P450 n=1 Tax=Heliocybe sulcata TaxID=5364 RepID=A0A5C3NDK0_9AGAM|nr:cytochrome P450 [Heliocybe sulcata]